MMNTHTPGLNPTPPYDCDTWTTRSGKWDTVLYATEYCGFICAVNHTDPDSPVVVSTDGVSWTTYLSKWVVEE